MAQAAQYNFSLRELTEALLRAQNIKEGKWVAGFELGLGVASIPLGGAAPNPKNLDLRPTAFMQINGVNISRYIEGTPETITVVDAGNLAEPENLKLSSGSKPER